MAQDPQTVVAREIVGDALVAYRRAVAELAQGRPRLADAEKNALEARTLAYFGSERLRFLIKLGADPVAQELAK